VICTATERAEPDRVIAIFAVDTVDETAGAALKAIDNARDKADALAQALDVEITGVKANLFDFSRCSREHNNAYNTG
jgi:uncharacterized protein YggE